MEKLSAEKVTLSYGQFQVLNHVDLQIQAGSVTVFIGANGSGKSTLLKALANTITPKQGSVLLDGQSIQELPSKTLAKKMAVLPQSPIAPEGLTVENLIEFGRHPYRTLFKRETDEDSRMVEWAIKATKLTDLRKRKLDGLSGGQKQRAWIAMALAQGTDILLLDEPTTFLDIAHQIEVLDLLKELNKKYKKTIVMVLHDLNQAAQYADCIVSIKSGNVYSCGRPEEVFNKELFRQVFGLEGEILKSPIDDKPLFFPHGLTKA
ncbi:ABC transporter ATP-binding protein [Bacillus zhangzhouensis]|nr:ABC transporter ATP-binding protein [Bacillus zhangzhouensis]